MSLLDHEINEIKETERKRRIGRRITFGFLGILVIVSIIRAVVLIFYPTSWLAKHVFIF